MEENWNHSWCVSGDEIPGTSCDSIFDCSPDSLWMLAGPALDAKEAAY